MTRQGSENEPQADGPPRALAQFAARIGGGGAAAADREVIADLDAAAAEAFSIFDARGVHALLLKGPAIAGTLYEEGETRAYSDVDVLIAPQHLRRARHVLRQLGYSNARDRSGIDDVGRVVHEESWFGRGPRADDRGAPAWERTVVIELHLWFPGAEASPQTVWRALAAHRSHLELAGRSVPILDREGLALHLAIHAAQHGPDFAKGLRELTLGLERLAPEVWVRAAELAREIGATQSLAAGLRLVPEGASLAQALGLPRNERLDWEIRTARQRPRGTFHLLALSRTHSPMERAVVIRLALLPSADWIVAQYPWARAGAAHLATAYVMHLARAPAWAVRAGWYHTRARRAGQARDR